MRLRPAAAITARACSTSAARLHEAERDHVDAAREAEAQIGVVLRRQPAGRQRHARRIDALVLAQRRRRARPSSRISTPSVPLDAQLDAAVVEQQPVAAVDTLARQRRVGGGHARRARRRVAGDDVELARRGAARSAAPPASGRCGSSGRSDPAGSPTIAAGAASPRRGCARWSRRVRLVRAVREVQAEHVHAGGISASSTSRRLAGRADRRDDPGVAHVRVPAYNRFRHAPDSRRPVLDYLAALIRRSTRARVDPRRGPRRRPAARRCGRPARLLRALVVAAGARAHPRDRHRHRLLGDLHGAALAGRRQAASRWRWIAARAATARQQLRARAGVDDKVSVIVGDAYALPAQGGRAVRSDLPGRRQAAVRAAARPARRASAARAACWSPTTCSGTARSSTGFVDRLSASRATPRPSATTTTPGRGRAPADHFSPAGRRRGAVGQDCLIVAVDCDRTNWRLVENGLGDGRRRARGPARPRGRSLEALARA